MAALLECGARAVEVKRGKVLLRGRGRGRAQVRVRVRVRLVVDVHLDEARHQVGRAVRQVRQVEEAGLGLGLGSTNL